MNKGIEKMESYNGAERRNGLERRNGKINYNGFDRRIATDRRTNSNGALSNSIFRGLHQKFLELQEERRAIVEKSGDAIFVIHSVSREIVEANHKATNLTGYPVPKLLEMTFEQLACEEGIPPNILESHSLNGGAVIRTTLKKQDGASISVDMSACPIHRDQHSFRLVFVRDSNDQNLPQFKSSQQYLDSQYFLTAEEDSIPNGEFPGIIGKSQNIRDVCQLIFQVAKTDSTVLIQGESGTGKEVVAQATHFYSTRSKGPFIRVNCAALSETLLESELFGHIKGSFTGAIRDRKGRFKQADGGTILLDEIGSMPLSGQGKLLRVLEEHEFEPVGSSATTSVNVRVIAASKTNLKAAVEEGRFREDLFYRLNVFTIFMAPLRERKEDIQLLAQHFLEKYNLAMGKKIRNLVSQTLDAINRYDWPGNIRELKNAIEHAVIVAKGPLILPAHLPSNITMANLMSDEKAFSSELGLRERLTLLEKQIIQDAITRANGVKKEAAAILHIDPRNFSYLLRKHNLIS